MMENVSNQLTRTCGACGIEKPLSAFLQLGGAHGTSYGKICSKCRGIGKTEKPAPTAGDEERSTAPSGIGIRGKEKLYADAKREQKIHTLKTLYSKEEIKKQNITDEKIERTHLKELSEQKHRAFYIDSKKTLDILSKKTPGNLQSIARQQTQKIMSARSATERHQSTLDVKKEEQIKTVETIAKEEIKKTKTDFNNLFHAITPGRLEMQSDALDRFLTYLGDSPIKRALRKRADLVSTNQSSEESANKNNKPSRRNR